MQHSERPVPAVQKPRELFFPSPPVALRCRSMHVWFLAEILDIMDCTRNKGVAPSCVRSSGSKYYMPPSAAADATGLAKQMSSTSLGSTSTSLREESSVASVARPIWGSIERNTGTWTPYDEAENELIEAAFARGADTVAVPTCFNAMVYFDQIRGYHHQITPAVGAKPAGFRSVVRGDDGQCVTLYWWGAPLPGMWKVDSPPPEIPIHTQEVTVHPPAGGPTAFTWQWCDLIGQAAGAALEINWHPYAPDHGAEIEAAWAQRREHQLVIGLTAYQIGAWEGAYGTQTNLTTHVKRQVRAPRLSQRPNGTDRAGMGEPPPPNLWYHPSRARAFCAAQVRRGRFARVASTPTDYVEESCALCTETFTDTPEWPIRRTPCNHAFHWTCLQHILRNRSGASRCPMCRASLQGMTAGGTEGRVGDTLPAPPGPGASPTNPGAASIRPHVHPAYHEHLPWDGS